LRTYKNVFKLFLKVRESRIISSKFPDKLFQTRGAATEKRVKRRLPNFVLQ